MRDAETYWTKIGSASQGEGKDIVRFSLIEAEPKTGRTHQIRVHFVAIQHPIVGDSLYAPKRPPALGFTRTALHSRSVEFENVAGEKIKVFAPLPEDFIEAAKELGIKMPATKADKSKS
jgi:23S rRNA-/tRNA-specific pseudouridylate synthase